MKDKESKYKEIAEVTGAETEEEQRRILRRASVAVIFIVLALVVVLSFVVYFVELHFGKTAGTVALVILAIAIAGYLYRNEIKSKFKRR